MADDVGVGDAGAGCAGGVGVDDESDAGAAAGALEPAVELGHRRAGGEGVFGEAHAAVGGEVAGCCSFGVVAEDRH